MTTSPWPRSKSWPSTVHALGWLRPASCIRSRGRRRSRPDVGKRDASFGALRAGDRGHDGCEIELERVGEDGVARLLGAEQALGLRVGFDERDACRLAAGDGEIVQRFVVDREEAAGGAVLGRHVGDGGAVGERQVVEAGAVELDELVDHALLAQHLRDGEHEVGGGDAFLQRAGHAEADDLGDQHRLRLAEHGGFGLDAADAPAEHGEPVDHRGVAVGADERIGIGECLAVGRRSRSRPSGRDIRGSPGGRCRCPAARRGSWRRRPGPTSGTRSARRCGRIRARRCVAKASALPKASTMTEWSMTRSTGTSGLIFLASPPSVSMPSRMAARSTTAGTPVKSCISTRAGRKPISFSALPLLSQPLGHGDDVGLA